MNISIEASTLDIVKDGMILVVGGAGYIGAHLCKQLHHKNYSFIVFDNLSTGHKHFVKWSQLVIADLNDKTAIESCFNTYPITAVMHFSAVANVAESVKNPQLYYQNNVVNTLNLLEIMIKYEVKTFIFSSTCATYGMPQQEMLTENHPQSPISPYGQSKLMVEQIVRDYAIAYHFNYAFLRYFNAAGADNDAEIGESHTPETHLIPLAIQAALDSTKCLTINGKDYDTKDGTCIRDYIHVNDLADAHILALDYLQKTKQNLELNLGTGTGHSISDIVTEVERVSGQKIRVKYGPKRAGDPPKLVADARLATKTLGWKPQYTLHQIIQTALKWHKTQ